MKTLTSILITLAVLATFVLSTTMTPPAQGMGGSSGCTGSVYQVRSGDWLSSIAARYHTTWQALATANRLANPNRIYPGEPICIPGQPVTSGISGIARAIYHPGQRFADTGAPGWCVYYAELRRPDINLAYAGNAKDLPASAARRGYHIGPIPAVGAIAIFQPNVQGASWQYGHAAFVTAVYADGTFQVAAMAAPWPWSVSYSLHWRAPGVAFIYG